MTKTILAMILGALCASAWWAVSRWAGGGAEVLYIPAVLLSFAALVMIAVESNRVYNGGVR